MPPVPTVLPVVVAVNPPAEFELARLPTLPVVVVELEVVTVFVVVTELVLLVALSVVSDVVVPPSPDPLEAFASLPALHAPNELTRAPRHRTAKCFTRELRRAARQNISMLRQSSTVCTLAHGSSQRLSSWPGRFGARASCY